MVTLSKELKPFFLNLNIEKGNILFLHARIKGIYEYFSAKHSYEEIAYTILEVLTNLYSPISILVPTYTYTFTKSGVYHSRYSKSEVGRFSEIIRLLHMFRSSNPIFSITEPHGNILKDIEYSNNTAFGEKSIFSAIDKLPTSYLNIDLPRYGTAPLHYYEQHMKVDYRYLKYFVGFVFDEEANMPIDCRYEYLVRKEDQRTEWNRAKIKNDLEFNKILTPNTFMGIETNSTDGEQLRKFIITQMTRNKRYLIDEQPAD